MAKKSKGHSRVLSWFRSRLPKLCATKKLVDRAVNQESPSAPLENLDGNFPFLLQVYFTWSPWLLGGTSASFDSRADSAASGPSTSRNANFSNVFQTVLPIVQAIGEGVPVAGGVIKAASGGALHLLQTKKVSLRCAALTPSHGLTVLRHTRRTRRTSEVLYRDSNK